MIRDILVDGSWRPSSGTETFQAVNPLTGDTLPAQFPISTWDDCDRALTAAAAAFEVLRETPGDRIAAFFDRYAESLQEHADELVAQAHLESGLPTTPRLRDVELPRTINQLRLAAEAVRDGGWRLPTIDAAANIRSYLAPIGPVCVFGPSNFPFAFGAVAGGDFAAAIAAGNPVIAKAHPLHPETARMLAVLAVEALRDAGLPSATVQLLYHLKPEDGERLVSDHRIAASAFTGSKPSGLRLKRAADDAGKLIFLELSSTNPVVILPGVLAERGPQLATEFCDSALMGGGQFCTNPGIVLLLASEPTEAFIRDVSQQYQARPAGRLMSAGVVAALNASVATLRTAGAALIAEGSAADTAAFTHANTLLRVSASDWLGQPQTFQTEAFGNASLFVVAASVAEASEVLRALEGNLTGCIYSAKDGSEDADYDALAHVLRPRVGRLLNDKMPTGVAVSPAMNHGGPYPATGNPHFTAVGIPASIRRFTALHCFDNVRQHRLPACLRD
ncbi:aldehyde dehydrogenase (NADP(+)) [Lacipirellula parvula]|uniref:2,5-dioxovalerate dehydrogenase n=1 Tax=Lacipirellula parvula TaxID=2650471 RepID=A0A5K7XAL1_9BACT|nr:aldehyde dehydrogenase (NADP(+)) [Lacipirellula parvula]BBO33740.1 2,5-dioxovalerate dehydrogenase [Lacipirellula parvula]